MKYLLKTLLSAIAVIILVKILPGVSVDTYWTAIIIALVLSFLNFFVKPILIILTLPVTIVTFGLFLLIINALIILIASKLIDGFSVTGIFWAFIFSFLLSLFQSILFASLKDHKKH